MVCYNTDKFKEFLQAPNFRAIYDISDAEYDSIINDDVERLKFGYRLLKQVLLGEESINKLYGGAVEQRLEERNEILEARRQAEIEAHKEKAPFEKYIDDQLSEVCIANKKGA